MAVRDNTIKKADTVAAIEQEMISNFRGQFDKLVETLGMFNIDTVAAGTALYQYSVTGTLNNDAPDEQAPEKGSSGTGYVEGDLIALSKYTVTKTPIGEVEFVPYDKLTTAQAILKGGYENAILRTDNKAIKQMRAAVMSKFFTFLGNGTTVVDPAQGTTWGLQEILAYTEAELLDKLEGNDDEGGTIVHFVNRQDAYKYLANATITTQDLFGMTYLENFLGVENVMLTNKVSAGTVFATPADNIHIFGIDYATLKDTGLEYATDELGLMGIAHEPEYRRASALTHLVRSANFVPEVTDYIAKGFAAHQV